MKHREDRVSEVIGSRNKSQDESETRVTSQPASSVKRTKPSCNPLSVDDESSTTRPGFISSFSFTKTFPNGFINRELSWLDFNQRVIEEADNPRNPLLERVRFLSISASNLDEFYSVRVAGLVDQVREHICASSEDGQSPEQQLKSINLRAMCLFKEQQRIWHNLRQEMADNGLTVCDPTKLSKRQRDTLERYFMQWVFPILTPLVIDSIHPLPFIPHMGLAMVASLLRYDNDNFDRNVVILLPAQIGRFIRLPTDNRRKQYIRFVILEDLVAMCMCRLFPGLRVGKWGLLRVIRDTDVEFSDEAEDLVHSYETALKRRRRGDVIHIDFDDRVPSDIIEILAEDMEIDPNEVFVHTGLIGVVDVKQLIIDSRPDLLFASYKPRFPKKIREFAGDMFTTIRDNDLLVYHPYESFDVVVQFLHQAARDPQVIAIKQTLYRTSHESPIVHALIEATESGKSVTAIIELRARFDEEANIRLARALESAGVQVVFGFTDIKIHIKLSMVVRKESGQLRSYTHFGTGNYHTVTARVYSDISYFTCNPDLVRDAARLFNYMTGYAQPVKMRAISYSPVTIRKTLNHLIEKEISHVKSGAKGNIWLKMNSLVDPDLINKLYEASTAGVNIVCIVRGICCLRPGVPGMSHNIHVKSIVGRFLEHARIFVFGNGSKDLPDPKALVYISSADWMQRNMDYRVESMVPMRDPVLHAQVLNHIMVANLMDNLQSWTLGSDGVWVRVKPSRVSFSAHEYFMQKRSFIGSHPRLSTHP